MKASGTESTPSTASLLEAIDSSDNAPEALRHLPRESLPQLCEELRQDLIDTISRVGGHFASSLGMVEIVVACHHSFSTPKDKIVYDVGHQAYVHKILTGRRQLMPGIRKLGGISGFPRRDESPYDTFGVGHAGTSISAALGMLEASHHSFPGKEDAKAVAIIGDGALTSGMAFEALNHAGQLKRNLIVILNDNEMSIAPNVGALSWAFSKAFAGNISTLARRQFKYLVEKGLIPHSVYRAIDKAEEAAQGFFSTPAMLFESFGFRYLGPVDGHNIFQLLDALDMAKNQDGPVIIHARTQKGKGYEPAENDPIKYHGVGPFDVSNGSFSVTNGPSKPTAPSYTSVFGKTLVELAHADKRVVGITAAMPDGTGLGLLQEKLPEQYFDVGIAEQHAVTFAAGLACQGMRPVVAIYSTFLQRAYDQIIHDVCIQSLPVTFALDRGGLVGADGATHHGVFDLSYLRSIPNMVVMAPKDESELRDMLYTCTEHNGPIALRYPRGNGRGVNCSTELRKIELGKAEVVYPQAPVSSSPLLNGTTASLGRKHSPRVLLLGLGITVSFVEEAADILEHRHGLSAVAVNARFLKPLDENLLQRLISTSDVVVTVEDNAIKGGFGSAVLEFAADNNLLNALSGRQFIRLGVPDNFVEHGTQTELYEICGFDVPSIVQKVLEATGYEGVKQESRSAGYGVQ